MKRRDLLGGIIAFLSFGLVEKASNASPSKEKAPKWLEETEKESRESYLKRLENITKAHEILKKYSDFTTQETECVRKAVCKRTLDCKEYRNRFVYTTRESHPKWISPERKIPIWDAICVTFRTCGREDGFQLIDCEFPKDLEEIEQDINKFKRIALPLVRRCYPALLV